MPALLTRGARKNVLVAEQSLMPSAEAPLRTWTLPAIRRVAGTRSGKSFAQFKKPTSKSLAMCAETRCCRPHQLHADACSTQSAIICKGLCRAVAEQKDNVELRWEPLHCAAAVRHGQTVSGRSRVVHTSRPAVSKVPGTWRCFVCAATKSF